MGGMEFSFKKFGRKDEQITGPAASYDISSLPQKFSGYVSILSPYWLTPKHLESSLAAYVLFYFTLSQSARSAHYFDASGHQASIILFLVNELVSNFVSCTVAFYFNFACVFQTNRDLANFQKFFNLYFLKMQLIYLCLPGISHSTQVQLRDCECPSNNNALMVML